MITVTIHDSLCGDAGPLIVEQFNTIEEAYDYGGTSLIEIAYECQDERAALAPLFMALGEVMRRGGVTAAGLDGYEVLISGPGYAITANQRTLWQDYSEINAEPGTASLSQEEGAMFLQYLLAQADPKVMPWIGECYRDWKKLMAKES